MSRKSLLSLDGSRSRVAEAYRSLRTNIIATLVNNPCRTILITSSLPREGKTTTLMNIGTTLAQAKKKVLVVDTDMRNPLLHKMMGTGARGGITGLVNDLLSQPLDGGVLGKQSLGDIFYFMRLQERTGILTLGNKNKQMDVRFHAGEVVGLNCGPPRRNNIRIVNAGVSPLVYSQLDDFPEWEHFLANTGPDTSYHFQDTEVITINGGADNIHWKMLLDKLPNLRHTPNIITLSNFYIQPTGMEGLWLLPCGQPPEYPAEYLGSLVMRELLSILSSSFDFILLDSPPVVPVTDACSMVSYVDGVIFVLRSRKVNRDIAIGALEQLQRVEANILGVVLNDIDIENDHYHYRQYREYPYGYGTR